MTPTQRFERRFFRPKKGRTLVVGSRIFSNREDRRRLYSDAIGADMEPGRGVDVVLDLEEDIPEWLGIFDHIDCLSTLEHSRRPWLMAANLERLLRPEGTIYITVPWVWRLHNYPGDYYRFNPAGLRNLFSLIEWESLCLASDNDLWPEDLKKVPTVTIKNIPYLQRCETCAFGKRI